MIQFRILGPLELRSADGREVRPVLQQPKRLALLAYLVLAGRHRFRRRDTLLGLFWPELDEDRARRALRQAVRFLRQSLGDDLIVERGRDEIGVDPAGIWCDAVACEEFLAQGRRDEALEVYRGDLLAGLFVADAAPELEQWLDSERAGLRRRAAAAASELSSVPLIKGNGDGALVWARRAVELAPDDEVLLRRLLILLEQQGNRLGALRTYEEFAVRLTKEFGAEPADETRAVAERLRARGEAPPTRTVPTPKRPTESSPFSGSAAVGALAQVSGSEARHRFPWSWVFALGLVSVLAVVLLPRRSSEVRLGRRTALAVGPEFERWPVFSPDGGTLFFMVSTNESDELVAQQVEGGRPVALTEQLPGPQRFGSLSPDGTKLLVHGADGLSVMPALGGQARLLVPEREPSGNLNFQWVQPGSWAPDGNRIVYPDHDTLYVQGLNGSGRVAIGSGDAIHSPAWSPDGRWIAYVKGNPDFHLRGNLATSSLFLIPAGGGDPIVLTDASALHTSPIWVPGRRALLFVSDREGGRDIYELFLNRDGSPRGDPVRITTGLNPERLGISSDGRRLVWSVFSEVSNIRILEIPERDPVPLSRTPTLIEGNQLIEAVGNISLDGHWLYYHGDRTGTSNLWRARLTGGQREQLTSDSIADFAPSISPDGRELAFHSLRTGKRDVFVMPVGGGSIVQVSDDSDGGAVPIWSPDGTSLLWGSAGGVRFSKRDSVGSWTPSRVLLERVPSGGGWSQWSPDGRWISHPALDGLLLFAPETGQRRVLQEAVHVGWHVWAPDGRTIFGIRQAPGRPIEVVAVPVGGGRPRVLAYADNPLSQLPRYGIALHGSRLYFPLVVRSADIWMGEVLSH